MLIFIAWHERICDTVHRPCLCERHYFEDEEFLYYTKCVVALCVLQICPVYEICMFFSTKMNDSFVRNVRKRAIK